MRSEQPNTTVFVSGAEKITYFAGTGAVLANIRDQAPLPPFAEETLGFLSALSEGLRSRVGADGEETQEDAVRMADVAAFAFWCRRAHLNQMKDDYEIQDMRRLGRGVSLHFAPANMPVVFAFSMAAGLLAGNCVIVRLPGKETPQERLIVRQIGRLLEGRFSTFADRIVLCRYPHDREVTGALSTLCDVRVIWGSDETVSEIRKSPMPPRSVDLPFAARGSAAVFDAAAVNRTKDLETLARDFYNDTYLNDQNACSSPRMIYWLGDASETDAAKARFWDAVSGTLAKRQYPVPTVMAVRKLDKALQMAVDFDGAKIRRDSNRIVRVEVSRLEENMWDYTLPCGFFIECGGDSIDGLTRVLSGRCQTLSVYGIDRERLADELVRRRVTGVDRIVPAGHALDFSLTWDGFDLIASMSRRVAC